MTSTSSSSCKRRRSFASSSIIATSILLSQSQQASGLVQLAIPQLRGCASTSESTRLYVTTSAPDLDTLLSQRMRGLDNNNEGEGYFGMEVDGDASFPDWAEVYGLAGTKNPSTLPSSSSSSPIPSKLGRTQQDKMKRMSVMPRKANRSAKVNSRSSTMPGYSRKQQLSADAYTLVQNDTARKPTAKDRQASIASRKKASGERMYKRSSSVPDSLVQFATELHKEDRITAREEVELGERTQEALRLQLLYDNLQSTLNREPTDEEWCAAAGKINMEAIRQSINEGIEAKNKLVTSNLRMVQGVVNVYIRNGLGPNYNAGDLMHDGIMALIRAAEKYEPDRGFRFSTYALYWIRAAVKRSQLFQSRLIHVPHRLEAHHKHIAEMDRELTKLLGRPPTDEEIGESLDMKVDYVKRCKRAVRQRCYSLDQNIVNTMKPMADSNGEGTMYDVVEGKHENGNCSELKRSFLREELIETMHRHLSTESLNLILLRYGLADPDTLPDGYDGPLTLAQVSELAGLKPDKVRRMIIKALDQLRLAIGKEWSDFEEEL